MALRKIRKGLNLPILGEPEQRIHAARLLSRVAVLAADFLGLDPAMFVAVGDTVKRGQPLFENKKTPGVIYTSPGAGAVAAIHRGEKGAFQSIVIDLSERERAGVPTEDEQQKFSSYSGKSIPALSRDDVRALLLESGLWTAFRTRPFSKVPNPASTPDGIFINAMDTDPLAAKPEIILEPHSATFDAGLAIIAKLREGKIFLCVAKDSPIKAGPYSGVSVEHFSGPHPAGTVGVHIHTLLPVDRSRTVWHLGYQDVVRIGKLFTTGRLDVDHVVALAGPPVKSPRLVRTRIGASLAELTADEITPGEVRVISGSVLSGRASAGEVHGYLGRYHQQVSCLVEDRHREFLGWLTPDTNKFSVLNVFASGLMRGRKKFAFTTSTHGSERPIVPIGMYEKVMPMDLLPTLLLRALIIGDTERAERLGCLELDEEDLALCTFVCPGKHEYAPYLRQVLARLEAEG